MSHKLTCACGKCNENKPLSEKEDIGDMFNVGFSTEDVKKAVEDLKEEIKPIHLGGNQYNKHWMISTYRMNQIINKIFGEFKK